MADVTCMYLGYVSWAEGSLGCKNNCLVTYIG